MSIVIDEIFCHVCGVPSGWRIERAYVEMEEEERKEVQKAKK